MNLFSDIIDVLTGGKIVPQDPKNLPVNPPLCPSLSISSKPRIFAVKERAISLTGEDFDINDITDGNTPVLKVRGAMLHLPMKDKMRITNIDNGEVVAVLDRKLMAVTPTFDIFRNNGKEKIGWMEKKIVSLTESFDVFTEGSGFGVTGVFKSPPVYTISGDFMARNFVMKNAKGEVVAKSMKEGWVQFDAFNYYQVQVAEGMDAVLVLACVCGIDEEFDEEHREKKAKERNEKS